LPHIDAEYGLRWSIIKRLAAKQGDIDATVFGERK
jgi:hypothetical protein